MFSCHRLCQRLSSPGPAGLEMQSTSRLLAYKTTTQKLFTQIIDARPAIKKFISQAELHRLLKQMSRQFDFEIHTPNLNSLKFPSRAQTKFKMGTQAGIEDLKIINKLFIGKAEQG